MQHEYLITITSKQFLLELVDEISHELEGIGRRVIEIVRPQRFWSGWVSYTRDGRMIPNETTDLTDYDGDAEIFMHAESRAHRDKGISVIVKDWDGEKSRLIIQYRDAGDWELVKDTWTIFEERIKQKGWKLMPKSTAAFAPAIVHDVRHLFEDSRGDSRQEQIEGIKKLYELGTRDKTPTNEQASRKMAANGNATMESIEITISGMPYEFAIWAEQFTKDRAEGAPRFVLKDKPRKDNENRGYFDLPAIDYAALPSLNPAIVICERWVSLGGGRTQVERLGKIIAVKIPGGNSQLRVVPHVENAAEFLREWELLRQEMIRSGFTKPKQDAQSQEAPVLTHQRTQTKQAKLMPRKLRHSLLCNANAADVVAVLFGGVGIRKMEIAGAQCAGEFELQCETSLSINTSLDSDYVVFISLTMRETESMETGREELLYWLWEREVAEIKIKQEQAGQCRMELFIDDNESQWENRLGLQYLHLRGMTAATPNSFAGVPKDIPIDQDQDGYENKSHGLPLIEGCWRTLKTEWVRHETATRETNAPAPIKQPTWHGKLDANTMSEQVKTLFDFIGDFFRGHHAVNLAPEPYWGIFQVELEGLPNKSLAAIIRIKKCVFEQGEYKSIDNEQHEIGRIELVSNTHAFYNINVLPQSGNEIIQTLFGELNQQIAQRFKNAAGARDVANGQIDQKNWHGNGEPQTPRDVTDELDKKILALVKDNPDLTDTNIGDEIGLTRQAVNARRTKLKAMGHKVR